MSTGSYRRDSLEIYQHGLTANAVGSYRRDSLERNKRGMLLSISW